MRVLGSSRRTRPIERAVGVLVLVGLASSTAFAGTITLSRDPGPVQPGETVDIYVDVATEELPLLHRVTVRLGSPDLLIGATDDFAFDAAFMSVAPITVTAFLNPTVPDTWQNGIVAAGSAFLDDIIPPFRLGTLTVTVPTSPFVIEAWGEGEMEWQGEWLSEDLPMTSVFVPEPSTTALMFGGLVGLALSRYCRPRERR